MTCSGNERLEVVFKGFAKTARAVNVVSIKGDERWVGDGILSIRELLWGWRSFSPGSNPMVILACGSLMAMGTSPEPVPLGPDCRLYHVYFVGDIAFIHERWH